MLIKGKLLSSTLIGRAEWGLGWVGTTGIYFGRSKNEHQCEQSQQEENIHLVFKTCIVK